MERSVAIRFSHIDGASIVFYPRYFEILGELFEELPFATPPFAMQTKFLKPNYLADEVQISFEKKESRLKPLPQNPLPQESPPHQDGWRFTGCMGGNEHFVIESLAVEGLDKAAHRPGKTAFQADPMKLAAWTTDCSGFLQVSRFFELLNAAVEQWFPRTLDMTFHELHTEIGAGIPTVVMRTRCRELPRAGESITIWIRPTEIGNKSVQYTCWLVRGDQCLLENAQTIVFVKRDSGKFKTIPIPDKVRERLQEQYVAS